jgi:hypothetical protein
MALSRASLAALIAANIADNTSEAITPALHRAVENALNDSLVNWVDDAEDVLTNSVNKVPKSAAVYAALAGVNVVTRAAFDALVAGNSLQTDRWYLVRGAFTDNIWTYGWDALVLADSTNTIRDKAFGYPRIGAIQSCPWVTLLVNIDFTANVICNCDDVNFNLNGTIVSGYTVGGVLTFADNINVNIEATALDGTTAIVKCTTKGNSPHELGYVTTESYNGDYSMGACVVDFSNDALVPTAPVTAYLQLSAADLAAGGMFDLLPKLPAGWYWSPLSGQYQYIHQTTAYTGLRLLIKCENGTRPIMESKNFDGATQSWVGSFNLVDDHIDSNQFVTADKLVCDVDAGTGGDATADVWVTAQAVYGYF